MLIKYVLFTHSYTWEIVTQNQKAIFNIKIHSCVSNPFFTDGVRDVENRYFLFIHTHTEYCDINDTIL